MYKSDKSCKFLNYSVLPNGIIKGLFIWRWLWETIYISIEGCKQWWVRGIDKFSKLCGVLTIRPWCCGSWWATGRGYAIGGGSLEGGGLAAGGGSSILMLNGWIVQTL